MKFAILPKSQFHQVHVYVTLSVCTIYVVKVLCLCIERPVCNGIDKSGANTIAETSFLFMLVAS